MSHTPTQAYYNNSATTPPKRVASQVLESAFFTKSILSKMAPVERGKVIVYVVIWLGIVLWRHTELSLIAVAAQAVFCEQILSRFFRFERLKSECEKIYDDAFKLLQSGRQVDVLAPEASGRYEIWKAVASFPTSPELFEKYNDSLNEEWNKIRATLQI